MEDSHPQQPAVILEETDLVSVRYKPRIFDVYPITKPELDGISERATPIALALFSLTLGICISFFIVLLTIRLDDRIFAVFIALTFASATLAAYFGLSAYGNRSVLKNQISEITKRSEFGVDVSRTSTIFKRQLD